MLALTLILLPIAGAIVVAIFPWPRLVAAGLAFLVALVEVGFWIVAAGRFDFDDGGLQLGTSEEWVESLGISYTVGFYGFSLWLTGVTVIVMAAAIGYALWLGRDRPRAYHALMLFLTGAVVSTFAAQDLLLFYVSFEAMLIPLYVLIGVWGGTRRGAATLTFVVYTMAGSLLMLASVVALGVTQETFSLVGSEPSDNVWIFLGFVVAFAVKAPLFPFHGWLPLAYREAPVEVAAVLSAIVSKTAVYGFLVIVLAKFPEPVEDFTGLILVLSATGLVYGSVLAFRAPDLRGIVAYSSLAQMGLITIGLFAFNDLGLDGAILQSVGHALVSATMFLLVGMVERRCGTGDLDALGGMARGRPVLATVLLVSGMIALAVPGSTTFAGEFLIMAGAYENGWGYAAVVALGIVLAAMYVLRLISAVLHVRPGPAVRDEALDLRPGELALVLPLVASLLVLSAWPALVTQSSFPGDRAAVSVGSNFSSEALGAADELSAGLEATGLEGPCRDLVETELVANRVVETQAGRGWSTIVGYGDLPCDVQASGQWTGYAPMGPTP
jgi:NADH-quinone oxidoreductase subunit M